MSFTIKPLFKITLPILVAVWLTGCVIDLDPVLPPTIDYTFVQGTTALDATAKKVMIDGVYEVSVASNVRLFGDVMTVKLADNGDLNMYTTVGVVYFQLRGGVHMDTAKFAGYWRGVQGTQTGTAYFIVRPNEGGIELAGDGDTKIITIRGVVSIGGRADTLVLNRVQELNEDTKDFQIIAHRGGGRNSERLGVSENTIEMVKLASHLGATGVEIDVRSSKDGVPIVFHDPTFTPRTVRGAYVIGNVENYTYQEMTELAILINGERIPTLTALLRAVIDETPLTLVWIDMKVEVLTDRVLQIIKLANDYAASKNRKLRIVYGIPTDEVMQAYLNSPLKGSVEVLCELGADATRQSNAVMYAQRFTEGVQRSTVEPLRSEGVDAYVWTLDDPGFIATYLLERYKGKSLLYNGILTNYPTLLASKFFVVKYKPK